MAKAFAFELGQRVNVPDWIGAQGMVTLPTGQTTYVGTVKPGEHLFYVTWIDERGQPIDDWFSESELLEANPPPVDKTEQVAESLAKMVWQHVPDEGDTTITLQNKSRKKPTRKSKSKKRK